MKFIVVLFGFVALVFAAKQEIIKIKEDKLPKIHNAVNACALESNVDPGLIGRLLDGTLPQDESSNKFLYCVTLKIGSIQEDGHLVIDKIVSYLGDHSQVKEFKEVFEKCNEATKEDPIATVVEMYECYKTRSPVLFSL